MELIASETSGDGGSGLKEEKRSEHSVGDDDAHHKQEIIVEEPPVANTERSIPEAGPSSSSSQKEKVDELETTKAEMGVVREENERLKMSLNKIMNEYRTLEMKFQDILKQGTRKNADKGNEKREEILEESDDLVSLSLGRVPSVPKNDEKMKVCKSSKDEEGDLSLGLECKFGTSKSGSTTEANLPNPSPENSCEVPKDEAGETLKTITRDIEDEVAQQNPAKKPRVCVRARCDTPTMNDGCQWRKYGQKIAKGNPCPRAYYRCTISPSCPVRKQVQRCAEDMSILMTTYEGKHNHSLPASATAMASTTSAAASMLLSASSTSIPSATTALSSSPSHPTITLDLTSHSHSHPPSSSTPFVRFASAYNNQPRYPSSSSLSFSAAQPYAHRNTNTNILSGLSFGRQQAETTVYQSYMQKLNTTTPTTLSQVITADPTFQSALAAALTSFIGNQGVAESLSHKMKWEEVFPPSNSSQTKSFMFLPPPSLPFSTPKSASASPPRNSHATD